MWRGALNQFLIRWSSSEFQIFSESLYMILFTLKPGAYSSVEENVKSGNSLNRQVGKGYAFRWI